MTDKPTAAAREAADNWINGDGLDQNSKRWARSLALAFDAFAQPSADGLADKVAPEMLAAYVAWEPPCEVDVSKPARALGLIRSAFFAGWAAALRTRQPADTITMNPKRQLRPLTRADFGADDDAQPADTVCQSQPCCRAQRA